MNIEIEKNLELKQLVEGDALKLFSLIDSNRLFLRKWLPWIDDNKSINDVLDFIKFADKQQKNNNGMQLGILSNNNLTGVIGYHYIDWMNKHTSIGYWLSEEFTGKGIATKATKSLVDFAFLNLGLNRIEIRCAPENYASRSIPTRLGFKEEGLLREVEWLYDHFEDNIVYGITKNEWTLFQ